MLVRSDTRVGGAVVLALILVAGNASFAGAERRSESTDRGGRRRRRGGHRTGTVADDGHCLQSHQGFFFDSTSKPQRPKKSLTACGEFSSYTCCNRTHTDAIKHKYLETAAAQFNSVCRDISQQVHCMSCHGDVGIGAITQICEDLCDRWYDACEKEFYETKTMGNGLLPCYGDPVLCAQLGSIVKSGREMCKRMGIRVMSSVHVDEDDDSEDKRCYDGTMPVEPGSEQRGDGKESSKRSRKRKRKASIGSTIGKYFSEAFDENALQTIGLVLATFSTIVAVAYVKGFGFGGRSRRKIPRRLRRRAESGDESDWD